MYNQIKTNIDISFKFKNQYIFKNTTEKLWTCMFAKIYNSQNNLKNNSNDEQINLIFNKFLNILDDFSKLNWFSNVVLKFYDNLTTCIDNLLNIRDMLVEEIKKINCLSKIESISLEDVIPNDFANLYMYIIKYHTDNLDEQEKALKCLKSIINNRLFLPKKENDEFNSLLKEIERDNIAILLDDDDEIILHEEIGCGGFGKVYQGTFKQTAEIVAVKEMKPNIDLLDSFKSFYNEIFTMSKIKSKYTAELVAIQYTYPLRILTKYYQGLSLSERIYGQNELKSGELTKIAYQIAIGMADLHRNHFIHRDLKPLNILLDFNNNVKISDYGLCIKTDGSKIKSPSVVGTPHYTAPEILAKIDYDEKSDVYSYAILLWEMLTKTHPFENKKNEDIYDFVVICNWRPTIPKECPKGLKNLIENCWSKNQNERYSFDEIVSMFSSGKIYFKNVTDCENIHQKEQKFPMFNLQYLTSVLKNPNDYYFNSVVNSVINNNDKYLIENIKSEKIIYDLANSTKNITSILLFATRFLNTSEEFAEFLRRGGTQMFISALEMKQKDSNVAALSFATKIPDLLLISKSLEYLPQIINLLGDQDNTPNKYILQFIYKFNDDSLKEKYIEKIANALPSVLPSDIDDQKTFDAVSDLTCLCENVISGFDIERKRIFVKFISPSFFVSNNYVDIVFKLIGQDIQSQPTLVKNILLAIPLNPNLSNKYQSFLLQIDQNNKKDHVLDTVIQDTEFLDLLSNYLKKEKNLSDALFLMFCLSRVKIASSIANNQILQSLLDVKGYEVSLLQILSSLTCSEDFCINTKYMDGIIHHLAHSLSGEPTVLNAAVRLILSISLHKTGCKILSEKGILDLFVQMFVSSSIIDNNSSYSILRNAMKFQKDIPQIEIPQIPLIASCLLHSLLYEYTLKDKILDTLVALVKKNPDCVQIRDIPTYILHITMRDAPLIVLQSLRLLAAIDSHKLAQISRDVLNSINQTLGEKNYQHPKIIKASIMILNSLRNHVDITDFIQNTKLINYLTHVCSMLSNDDKRLKTIKDFIENYKQFK